METNMNKKVFGVYQTTQDAQRAVEDLLNMGYTSEEISVISRNQDRIEGIEGVETATETGLKGGAATGAAIGGLGGLLASLGLLAIPGIGPILAAGPIAATLAGAVTGGTVGGTIGVIGGALIDAGVSEEDARYLDERFQAGDIIVTVDSDDDRYRDVSTRLGHGSWRDQPTSYELNPMDEVDPIMADPANYSGTSPQVPVTGDEPVQVRDNLVEHKNFNENMNAPGIEDERSYENLMAGAGAVNPVDPTVSTGFSGREFDNLKEEPMKDHLTDAKHEALKMKEKVERRLDNAGEPLEDAQNWVGDRVSDVKHEVGKAAEKIDDRMDNDLGFNDSAKPVDEFENKMQDSYTDSKHEVEKQAEKLQRRAENVGEPLEDAQNWVGDRVSDAKHEAAKIVDKIKNRIDD